MTPDDLTRCPICSYCYDVSAPSLCEACPLNAGCTMLCCPSCGHTTVDPDSSSVAKGVQRVLSFIRGWGSAEAPAGAEAVPGAQITYMDEVELVGAVSESTSLSQIPVGQCAIVTELSADMPLHRTQALLAYGVEPGRCLFLLQQSPLTVLRVGQMELALEHELAELIEVSLLNQTATCGGVRRPVRQQTEGTVERAAD